MFLLCFILNLILNPVNADELLPFEQVSKNAESMIVRVENGDNVDVKEISGLCRQLIDHASLNLEKGITVIPYRSKPDSYKYTEDYKVFHQSMFYLKKLPIDRWGLDFVSRMSNRIYHVRNWGELHYENNVVILDPAKLKESKAYFMLLHVAVEISDYAVNNKLPDYFLDFLAREFYSYLPLSSLLNHETALLVEKAPGEHKIDAFEVLVVDIASYNARKSLLEGESYSYSSFTPSRWTAKDDIEKLDNMDLIDPYNDFEDIEVEEIKDTKDNRELAAVLNSAMRYERFKLDMIGKIAPVDPLELINEYLPAVLEADNMAKAEDNLAWYIASTLNGKMDEKENILLFGAYTEGGRKGGVFKSIKSPELKILFGILAQANGFCQTIEVSRIVQKSYEALGLIDKWGNAKDPKKFDPSSIEQKMQIKFSAELMKRYNSCADPYRVKLK